MWGGSLVTKKLLLKYKFALPSKRKTDIGDIEPLSLFTETPVYRGPEFVLWK